MFRLPVIERKRVLSVLSRRLVCLRGITFVGVLGSLFCVLMLPEIPQADACSGSPPPVCGRTVRMAKNFPTTIALQPGAGTAAILPVDVTVFQTSVCTGMPISGSVTMNFTNCTALTPPFGPVFLSPSSVTVSFIPVLGNQTVFVPVTFTGSTAVQCTVDGSVSVTWSGGQTLTDTGDTVICLVEPADHDPSLPRLDLMTVGPSVVRVHPGDQGRHVLMLTNNDLDESVTVTLAATSTQSARMPVVSGGGEEVLAFDNGTINPFLNAPASQSDLVFPFESASADDFSLPQDAAITGVRFTGINFGATTTFGADGFDGLNITIYEDAGGEPAGSPGPDGEGSHIGGIVYQLAPGDFSSVQSPGFGFVDVHDFTADLPSPFVARAGVTYWIEIQAVMEFDVNGQWGVGSVGPTAFGQPSQAGFPLIGVPFWTDAPKGLDLAFQLMTQRLTTNQEGPFAIADPGVGDNFPIEFGPLPPDCETGEAACIPLPHNPMDFLPPTVEKTVTLGPGQSEEIELFSRGWGMCGDGSCSEIIIEAVGSYSGGDPAATCVGVSTVLDVSVPSTYECEDACITAQVKPDGVSGAVLVAEPLPGMISLLATQLQEVQMGSPDCPLPIMEQVSESLFPTMGRLGVVLDASAPGCEFGVRTTEAIVSLQSLKPGCEDGSCVDIQDLQWMLAPESLIGDYFTIVATAAVASSKELPDHREIWMLTFTVDVTDPPLMWGPIVTCILPPPIAIDPGTIELLPISASAFLVRFDTLWENPFDLPGVEVPREVRFNMDVRACAGVEADSKPDPCCQTPFDSDSDDDVDLVDFGQFQLCFTGPGGGPVAANCLCHDGDGDEDVDLVDFGAFQLAFTGPM